RASYGLRLCLVLRESSATRLLSISGGRRSVGLRGLPSVASIAIESLPGNVSLSASSSSLSSSVLVFGSLMRSAPLVAVWHFATLRMSSCSLGLAGYLLSGRPRQAA